MPEQKASIVDSLISEQRKYERFFAYALINDPIRVLETCGWMSEDLFADDLVRKFWKRIKESEINCADDAVRASIESGLFFEVNEVGASSYVFSFEEWANQISKLAYFRRVMGASRDLVSAVARREENTVREVLEKTKTLEVQDGKKSGISMKELDAEFAELLSRPPATIRTYLPEVDKMMGGFYPGELTVIAARPGIGKTALMLQMARQIAFAGKKALLISMEMARSQVWARMACGDASLEWYRVRDGEANEEELERLAVARRHLVDNLDGHLIVDDESWDVFEVERSVIVNNPDIVMIDQLPDVRWHIPNESPVEWYGKACWYFRQNIARRRRLPVVLVHQINRDVEDRRDKRPMLSDLRMSGEIEQRADIVLGLYREDIYSGRTPGIYKVPFEISTLKNRQGNAGNIASILEFDLQAQWFR